MNKIIFALLCGVILLTGMYVMGSTVPERVARRVMREIPAKQPDSYFVPTPLPVPTEQGSQVSEALGQIIEAHQDEQANHNGTNQSSPGRTVDPIASGLAIVAATRTPESPTALGSTEQEAIGPQAVGSQAAATEQVTGQESFASNQPTAIFLPQQADSTQEGDVQQAQPSFQILPTGTPTSVTIVGATVGVPQTERVVSDVPTAVSIKPTQTTAILPKAAAPAVALANFSHEWQTWNNCGPATLAMNLSFFGSRLNQADIGAVLRQHDDDKNVKPEELVAFALSQGYHAQLRVNGSEKLMKTLLSNEIPVLIETWMEPDPNDGMGHYRLLTGYDDAAQHWIAFDSYVSHDFVNDSETYEGIVLPFAETDEMWGVFNRTYLLIYDDSKADVVRAIFGQQLEPDSMWQEALASARTKLAAESHNPFAWFNLGSTLNELGEYREAAAAFDQARQLGLPWRMLWYQFGPFEAYYETGRYDEVMALAYANIANTESIEEIYYWKGRGLAATGNPESAKKAWQQALLLNPSHQESIDALAALE